VPVARARLRVPGAIPIALPSSGGSCVSSTDRMRRTDEGDPNGSPFLLHRPHRSNTRTTSAGDAQLEKNTNRYRPLPREKGPAHVRRHRAPAPLHVGHDPGSKGGRVAPKSDANDVKILMWRAHDVRHISKDWQGHLTRALRRTGRARVDPGWPYVRGRETAISRVSWARDSRFDSCPRYCGDVAQRQSARLSSECAPVRIRSSPPLMVAVV